MRGYVWNAYARCHADGSISLVDTCPEGGVVVIAVTGVASGRWNRQPERGREARTAEWLRRRMLYPGGKKYRAAMRERKRNPALNYVSATKAI
jgi:hypothetical protein